MPKAEISPPWLWSARFGEAGEVDVRGRVKKARVFSAAEPAQIGGAAPETV